MHFREATVPMAANDALRHFVGEKFVAFWMLSELATRVGEYLSRNMFENHGKIPQECSWLSYPWRSEHLKKQVPQHGQDFHGYTRSVYQWPIARTCYKQRKRRQKSWQSDKIYQNWYPALFFMRSRSSENIAAWSTWSRNRKKRKLMQMPNARLNYRWSYVVLCQATKYTGCCQCMWNRCPNALPECDGHVVIVDANRPNLRS